MSYLGNIETYYFLWQLCRIGEILLWHVIGWHGIRNYYYGYGRHESHAPFSLDSIKPQKY